MSNWQEMFEKRPIGAGQPSSPPNSGEDEPDWAPPPDPSEYRPWLIQRGGRPAMFIDLRRFEPKSGTLLGCLMSYPALIAAEYIGDQMLALDFGTRHFILEGNGLTELAARLQQGSVLYIQEYSEKIWHTRPLGPKVTKLLVNQSI
jgi:hypothetical protein